MASSSTSGGSTAARSQAAPPETDKRAATETAVAYVQRAGQRAVDVPVGFVLITRDRVTGAVAPWTQAEARSQELNGLGRQVKAGLEQLEGRGGQARHRATERVRSAGRRVSGRARKLESTVEDGRLRIEGGLRHVRTAIESRTSSSSAS